MDQRTRKLMTMHRASYPRDDIYRIYVSRKEGGKGLANIEDSVDASIRGVEDYIKKSKERLMTVASKTTDHIRTNRTTTETTEQKWKEKQLFGYLRRRTGKISHEKTDMATKEKP